MKLFPNTSLWALSLLLTSSLIFTSCHKDEDETAKVAVPLIAKAVFYNSEGELDLTEIYEYDDQDRIILVTNPGISTTTLEYTSSSVIVNGPDDTGAYRTSTLQLDSKGLCTDITIKSSKDNTAYLYDGKGYRQSSSSIIGTRAVNQTFTVSEGNYAGILLTDLPSGLKSSFATTASPVKGSFLSSILLNRVAGGKRLKSVATNYILKSDFLFFTDKINTIGDENRGISFMGKQNKNPMRQEINTLTYNNEAVMPQTITYSYEYDTKGRISKGTSSEGNYALYTYID